MASTQDVLALEPVDFGLPDEDAGFEYKSVSLGAEVDDDFDDGNLDKVLLAAHRSGSPALAGRNGEMQDSKLDDLGPRLPTALPGNGMPLGSREGGSSGSASGDAEHGQVKSHPTVVDDFVRNFLVRNGMLKTLDTFNQEWYERKERGLLGGGALGEVPDVYARNQ